MADEPNKETPLPDHQSGEAGDRPSRQSLAEYEERLLQDEEEREEKRRRVLTALLVAILLLGAALTLYLLDSRTHYELQVTQASHHHQGIVELLASVKIDRPATLRLGQDERSLAPGGRERITFSLPFSSLELGENVRELELRLPDGKHVTRKKLYIFKDFDVEPDLSAALQPPHRLRLSFRLPRGWKLEAQGRQLQAPGGEVTIPLQDLFAAVDEQRASPVPIRTPLRIVRPDGTEVEVTHEVAIPLPVTRLVLEAPQGKLTVLAAPVAVVRGRTEPGAAVTVGGRPVTVGPRGEFAVEVELGPIVEGFSLPDAATTEHASLLAEQAAERQGLEVEIIADAPQKVKATHHIDFLRVSPAAARRWDALHRGAGSR